MTIANQKLVWIGNWAWQRHAYERYVERGAAWVDVERALNRPRRVECGHSGRVIRISDHLRIVTEGRTVVTIIWDDRHVAGAPLPPRALARPAQSSTHRSSRRAR